MALSDEELDRYARHIVLPQVGGAGQLRLKAAKVAVVGAGGIGAGAIPALTGAGVGHLTIIDDDRPEVWSPAGGLGVAVDRRGERPVRQDPEPVAGRERGEHGAGGGGGRQRLDERPRVDLDRPRDLVGG